MPTALIKATAKGSRCEQVKSSVASVSVFFPVAAIKYSGKENNGTMGFLGSQFQVTAHHGQEVLGAGHQEVQAHYITVKSGEQ